MTLLIKMYRHKDENTLLDAVRASRTRRFSAQEL